MAIMIFSGIDRPSHLDLLAAEHATGMINITHALQPKLQQAYMQQSLVPLVLDSYHYPRDIQAFIATIEQIGSFFRWISNLDVIGDQRASNHHFEYLQAHLVSSLLQKVLWILQPDGSLEELEDMAHRRQLVGIGGIVPMLKQQGHERVFRYLMAVGERLMHVGAQAHVFGLVSPSIIFRIRSEPWLASLDSSKWTVAYRAKEVLRMSGTGQCRASDLGLFLTPDEIALNNMRVMHFWLTAALPMQLALFEEIDDMEEECDQAEEDDEVFRYMVQINDTLCEAFTARFSSWVCSFDGIDEEDKLIIVLEGPATLEQDLTLYMAVSQQKYDDYAIWRDEDDAA